MLFDTGTLTGDKYVETKIVEQMRETNIIPHLLSGLFRDDLNLKEEEPKSGYIQSLRMFMFFFTSVDHT